MEPPAAAALIGRLRPVLKTEKPDHDPDRDRNRDGEANSPSSKQRLLLKVIKYQSPLSFPIRSRILSVFIRSYTGKILHISNFLFLYMIFNWIKF